jgi:glutathione S-transferase
VGSWGSVEEAQGRCGMRLVLTVGVPGPWGEYAKGILHVKQIPHLRVAQQPGQPNEELAAWTGETNAPQLVYDDEPARTRWNDILFLAERLAPEPPLLPGDAAERALCFGIAAEIAGEGGLGWSRRLMMLDAMQAPGLPEAVVEIRDRLGTRYGYTPAAAAAAPTRCADILRALTARLREQQAKGSPYFVGERLSVADLTWATFANLVEPLPADVNPMPDAMRATYTVQDPTVRDALDPILFEHRAFVYEKHLTLPLDF